MITAKKSKWSEYLFAVYNKNLLRRRFCSFEVSGLSELTSRDASNPLLIYANHSGWWDGLVAFEISRKTKLDGFYMMEEKQLKKLFLFRRLGTFSVNRQNARDALASINYAAMTLMEKHNRALWIFPQGEILSNDIRPLNFYSGLTRIIQKTKKVAVVPAAIRYEFLGEYKPRIFVKIGKIITVKLDDNFTVKNQTEFLADKLTRLLDELKAEIIHKRFDGFVNII